jgi:ATPase family associated with various cellular activities (AAA)
MCHKYFFCIELELITSSKRAYWFYYCLISSMKDWLMLFCPKSVIKYALQCMQAVANSTSATFLRVVGSELIQKYLGDGPKLVRELFRVADDLSPSIVFIDEIDAIGTKRFVGHLVFYSIAILKHVDVSVNFQFSCWLQVSGCSLEDENFALVNWVVNIISFRPLQKCQSLFHAFHILQRVFSVKFIA